MSGMGKVEDNPILYVAGQSRSQPPFFRQPFRKYVSHVALL